MRSIIALGVTLFALSSLVAHAQQPTVSFDWFEYVGHDPVFEQPLAPGGYRNPILAGFYPDPSITRVGRRYYLVNSTFTYFPGIAVFESTDLIHWRQIGNVIDRLAYGHVIDFLDFHVRTWHWPAFNLADSAITIGAVLLVFDELRRVRGAR